MIVKWVRTMPSVVGNLVVQNSNGSFNLGDFYNVSPKENTKAYNGSGASNVGFVVNNSVSALVNNGRNANNDINGNKHQTDKARNAGSDRLKAQRISKRNERILPADHSIRALNAHTRKEY